MKFSLFNENLRIAVNAIRSNLTRTVLTILIIAIGIMALVGILTSIDALKGSINSQFTRMGANTFTIQNKSQQLHMGGRKRNVDYKVISYREALRFKRQFNFPATVSVSVGASGTSTVRYKSKKTNPNIPVRGVDENYILTAGYDIAKGRNFTDQEIRLDRHVVIIGNTLRTTLFSASEDPINKIISIGNGKYKIVGVLESKGTSMGGGGDNLCLLPLTNVRQYFARPDMSYLISVMSNDAKLQDIAMGEAEGTFRKVRKLLLQDENNFEIVKSDNLVNMMFDNIKYVTVAATIIGIITLIGAAIGLMNIMLVSVSERTREIGTRKALGATAGVIKQQFLFEAIFIGQLGGLLGILLGILAGNLVSLFTEGPFVIPWIWIIGGVMLCFIVGLLSGIFPAIKASRLDPIIALRYE